MINFAKKFKRMKTRITATIKHLTILIAMSLFFPQAHSFVLHVSDNDNKAVANAIVCASDRFWYTDSLGYASINTAPSSRCRLNIRHVTYEPLDTVIASEYGADTIPVTLAFGLHPPKEVTVSNRTPMQWVGDAIAKIPGHYHIPLESGVSYNSTIHMTGQDQVPLIQYSGKLNIRMKNKEMYVSNDPEQMHVSPNAGEHIYTVKPHEITDIMGLRNHSIIRDYKRYTYDNLEWISYRGADAVKIGFTRTKKGITQEGYLIIGIEDMAIMHTSYTISPIKDWIGEKTRRGFTKTSLNGYYIASEFGKDTTGKYTCVGGTKKIVLSMKTGKTTVATSLQVNLAATPFHDLYPNWRPLKMLIPYEL